MSKGYAQSKVISELTEFLDQISFTDACAEIKIQNSTLRMLEKLYMYAESVCPCSSNLKIHHLLDRIVRLNYDKFIESQHNHSTCGSGAINVQIIGRKILPMHKPAKKCGTCDGHGMVADG